MTIRIKAFLIGIFACGLNLYPTFVSSQTQLSPQPSPQPPPQPSSGPSTSAPPIVPIPSSAPSPSVNPTPNLAPQPAKKNRVFKKVSKSLPTEAPSPENLNEIHNESQAILETIENQLRAIQNHDFASAYHNYTTADFQAGTSLDEFIYFVEYYSVLNKNKNALFGAPEFTRHFAVLRGSLTGLDGETYKTEYYFAKQDGTWKVHGLKLIPQGSPSELPEPRYSGANHDFQQDILDKGISH